MKHYTLLVSEDDNTEMRLSPTVDGGICIIMYDPNDDYGAQMMHFKDRDEISILINSIMELLPNE